MQFVYVLLGIFIGILTGGIIINHYFNKMYIIKREEAEKFQASFMLLKDWISMKQRGVSVSTVLKTKGYQNVIIYGMGHIGYCLVDELIGSDINVLYSIDKVFSGNYRGNEIKKLSQIEVIEDADVIIVTPFFCINQIEEVLKNKTKADIISIEEIIYSNI